MEKKKWDLCSFPLNFFIRARQRGFSIDRKPRKLSLVFISFFIRRINHRKKTHFSLILMMPGIVECVQRCCWERPKLQNHNFLKGIFSLWYIIAPTFLGPLPAFSLLRLFLCHRSLLCDRVRSKKGESCCC